VGFLTVISLVSRGSILQPSDLNPYPPKETPKLLILPSFALYPFNPHHNHPTVIYCHQQTSFWQHEGTALVVRNIPTEEPSPFRAFIYFRLPQANNAEVTS
jgi:hypothetical protein